MVKFTIEPAALKATPSGIKNLLNCWEDHGVLEELDSKDETIGGKIDCLDHNFKDKWKTALKERTDSKFSRAFIKCRYIHVEWEKINTIKDLDIYKDEFDIALMEEIRALYLNVDEDCPIVHNSYADIEVTLLEYVHLSEKLKKMEKLAKSEIPIGKKIDDLWAERFQILAQVSKQITIVDRYAAWNFHDGKNDLLNLFTSLNNDSPGCSITIYSSPDAVRGDPLVQYEIAKKLKNMVSELGLLNIQNITLHLSPNDIFDTHAHHRYIRFDRITCELDRGIGVFRHARTRENHKFACKSGEFRHEALSTEKALRKFADTSRLKLQDGNWQLLP